MISRSPRATSNPRPSRAARGVAPMQNDDLEFNTDPGFTPSDEDAFASSSTITGERRHASTGSISNHGSVNSKGSGERAIYSVLNTPPIEDSRTERN